MQIVASRIALQGQHSTLVEQRRSEMLRIERARPAPPAVAAPEPTSADPAAEQFALEQEVLLLKMLVETLSGRKINVARIDTGEPQESAAPAMPTAPPRIRVHQLSGRGFGDNRRWHADRARARIDDEPQLRKQH